MNRYWSLSEALYSIFHDWPKLVAAFLIGCVIGWGISYIWPAPYRATMNYYVALNPYRAFNDQTFLALANPKYSNLDDYKNWQMSQLQYVIFLDDILEDTLERLKEKDVYWKSITIDELRGMLYTNWRSVGKWSMVAEAETARDAQQAVNIWSQVIDERLGAAINAARRTFRTDDAIKIVTEELLQNEGRLTELVAIEGDLQEWMKSLSELPQDLPIEPALRLELIVLISQVASFTPTWNAILGEQPSQGALPQAYMDWIDKSLAYLQNDITTIEENIASLQPVQTRLEEQYSEAADRSLGLSPNLEVESVERGPIERARPTGLLTLISGFIGLCLWLLFKLIRITNNNHEFETAPSPTPAE